MWFMFACYADRVSQNFQNGVEINQPHISHERTTTNDSMFAKNAYTIDLLKLDTQSCSYS